MECSSPTFLFSGGLRQTNIPFISSHEKSSSSPRLERRSQTSTGEDPSSFVFSNGGLFVSNNRRRTEQSPPL
nr:hypothetical protein Iba_chr11aCG15760 [Ipomoea batatas]